MRIESRHALQALKALADCFGGFYGAGDLQVRIKGEKIVYCMTAEKCLLGFTPYDEWEGAELGEGDFLFDIDCCF